MEEIENNKIEEENMAIKVIEKTDENQLNENEIPKEEKKKNKLGMTIIIVTIVLLLLAVFSTIFAVINMRNTKILKGIKIDEIDISNMTIEKAKEVLEKVYLSKAENEILFTYEDFEITTTFETLEVKYEIEKALKEAQQIGRSGNLFKDNFDILKSWIIGNPIELEVTIDIDMINQIMLNINNSLDGAVVQPSHYIENDKLIITIGQKGLKIVEKQLIEEIYNIVRDDTQTQTITIPLVMSEPEQINIEKIYQEVYKEVQDAYYTKDPFTIYPEVKGIDFDIENAKQILQEEKEKYEIPLIITEPKKTIKQIGTEAFPDLLATFSTNYNSGQKDRTTNLVLAAKKINGTILLVGEEFSYNRIVGERTIAAGFKSAATFSGGKVVDGLGGGICQISSTLYNAVIMTNLEVTERRNHQFVTSYVPAGKDATVVWGSQDFKFKNTRKYPIRITATVSGGVATVQVWGIKEEVEYDITIETKKTATTPYKTEYVQDESLPAGQQKVVQQGSNGRKVEAYKVVRLNGEVVSTTLLSKDTYNAMPKIVHIGPAQ